MTAIPLSLAAAVLVLRALGASINTMTLGGMAIAIGALVDDAIIDVENVVRRLRENRLRPEAERLPPAVVSREATLEIRTSIVFATIIIVLVFLPLFGLVGRRGTAADAARAGLHRGASCVVDRGDRGDASALLRVSLRRALDPTRTRGVARAPLEIAILPFAACAF